MSNRGPLIQLIVAVAILGAYWVWFAFNPLDSHHDDLKDQEPSEESAGPERLRVPHWQKHTNPAAQFDYWFLNLFPASSLRQPQSLQVMPRNQPKPIRISLVAADIRRERWAFYGRILRRLVSRPEPYKYNRGGYQTLNFIPSYVTMLFGLITGEFIRRTRFSRPRIFVTLLIAGLILLESWLGLAGNRHLSAREKDLDAKLDVVQHWLGLVNVVGVLWNHRRSRMEGVVISIRRCGDEFDRALTWRVIY